MTKISLRLALLLVLSAGAGVRAADEPPSLRIVAPTSQSMPMLKMVEHRPVGGVLKDLGELLAQRLGAKPVFLPFPSKRAGLVVAAGEADLLCYVKPEWIDDKVLWTRPFLAGVGVIAASASAPPVSHLHDLRDEPLGTVLGYRYPVIEQAFKQPIRREDTIDAEINLRRLAFGRVRYAVTDRAALAYYLKNNLTPGIREVLDVEHYQLGCALAPGKADLLQPLNKAIERIVTDGSLETLLSRYR